MSSRDKILAAVLANQPAMQQLPDMATLHTIRYANAMEQFENVLHSIGGTVLHIQHTNDIYEYVNEKFSAQQNLVTTIPELSKIKQLEEGLNPHLLENIDLAILSARFAVAENGAVWLTEEEMKIRALPFICKHLAVVLPQNELVHTMHEAYDLINTQAYDFGVFIAGPSKTADIEQSLVLGAHGPKTMTVFVVA